MEALLLAGGLGTRIRPLTYTRPKPLLPIANQPMIQWVLDRMPKSVTRVILPVNYLGELVRAHIEEHPDPRLLVVDEPEPLGTGGAIKNCADLLSGPFLVYNADIVSSVKLDEMIAFHRARQAEATISLWPVEEPWHFGVVRHEPDGRIREFVEKPLQGQEPSKLINAGHYLLEPSMLDRIPEGRFVSLEREVLSPMAEADGRLFGYSFNGFWVDCGRPESYLDAHRVVLKQRSQERITGQGVRGLTEARFESYALGDGCRLGKGARVERSVLLSDVVLGAGSAVQDSILGEGVEVEDGARVERCVVGDFAVIQGGAHIRDQRIGMRAGDA